MSTNWLILSTQKKIECETFKRDMTVKIEI